MMISTFFPTKTLSQLRGKYNREVKKNNQYLEEALRYFEGGGNDHSI